MIKAIKKSANNKGFTLAETLITLVIIGIVAALTVPQLYIKNQTQEFESRLQKAYSTLATVHNQILFENGGKDPAYDLTSTDKNITGAYCDEYFAPKLQRLRKCKNEKNCTYKEEMPFKTLGGTRIGRHLGLYDCLYTLSDGIMVDINFGYIDKEGWQNTILYFVDLNGPKGPNIEGLDHFIFEVTPQGGFKPHGYWKYMGWKTQYNCETRPYCNRDSGAWCAQYVLGCTSGKITYR